MVDRITKNNPPIYKYLLVLLAMFLTDSPLIIYSMNPIIAKNRVNFMIILPIILFVTVALVTRNWKVKKQIFIYILLITINIVVSDFFAGDSFNATIALISKVCLACTMPSIIDYADFKKIYIVLMRVICICSLILMIGCNMFGFLENIFPKISVYSSDGTSTYRIATLFFSNVYLDIPSWTSRNFGPFWEPGAYATYICVFQFIILFTMTKYRGKMFDLILSIITLVSTASLGGISSSIVLVIIYLIYSKRETDGWLKIGVICVILLAVIYILNNNEITTLFASKLDRTRYNGSTDSRLFSIVGNLKLFINSPIWGNGIQSVDTRLFLYYLSKNGIGETIHNTNTFLIYFSSFGIFMGCFMINLCYKRVKNITLNTFYRVLLVLGLVIVFSNEDFTGSLWFNLFMFYSLFEDKSRSDEYEYIMVK